MRNSATPNAAQGIMAMVKCLNILKSAEGTICTGREMTRDDAEAWAAHMVNEDGTTGYAPLDEATIAEKKALADDLLAQLRAAEDPIALFDQLMNEYSEDTGLEANPDGYVFTSGQMVEPFEEGTRALDYGQISGIVESDYGFHIILRLDPAEVELIRSDWALNQLSQQSTQWVEEAEIVTTETYDNLNVGDFYEKLTTYRDALNGTEDSTSDTQDPSGSDPQTQEETSDTQADANTQEGDAATGTTDGEADAAGTGEDASGDSADSADTGDTATE